MHDQALCFHNGHFVMVGSEVEGKLLMRVYSITSPNYREYLEFFGTKMQNDPLTSRLQHPKVDDKLPVSKKSVGALVLDDLLPGKNPYSFGTGTSLASLMSIIQDPDTYECFGKVMLLHNVCQVSELAYADFITRELPNNKFFNGQVREKLIYYPMVTCKPFRDVDRLADLVDSDRLPVDIGLPLMGPTVDRIMICGSLVMLKDACKLLDARGFKIPPRMGEAGDYVIKRAFVER